MTTSPSNPWTPKPAALRDLILLMLHEQGTIIDGTGRVASRIREYFTIPDTKTVNTQISEVLGLMEQTKLIKRGMNEGRTRTYGIEPVEQLTDDAVRLLKESREANLALFVGSKADSSEVSLAELVRQCQLAYRELQGAASRAPRRDTSGRVAINAAGVLKAVGFGTVAAKPLRYYLKELGLIRSHNQCDDTDAQLWWWTVSTDPIDTAKLRGLATSDRSFEKHQERRHRERSGTPEAGPVTVRKVGDDPTSSGPQPGVSEAERIEAQPAPAPRPGPQPGRRAATPQVTVQATNEDPVEALLAIITKLERQLEDERKGRREDREMHNKELTVKDGEIAELHEQLARRQALDPRVAEVIARFSNE